MQKGKAESHSDKKQLIDLHGESFVAKLTLISVIAVLFRTLAVVDNDLC